MSANQYSCVFICEKGKITREMLHAEFEAILDSFVPLQEYAGQEMKAIFVRISPQLKVVAAVYFLIGFDGAGNADRRWNVPLEQLAEQAGSGPNLGAGPIRLACRSQCPVAWHMQSLWDPNMASEPNDFVMLRDVVKRNKLGFKKIELEVDDTPAPEPVKKVAAPVDVSDADKSLSADLVQFLRKKLDEEHVSERDEMAKKQRLLLAAQKTQFEDEINKLEESHSEELRTMQQKFHEYHKVLEDQKRQNEKLRGQLETQEQVVADTKELFEKKLAKNKEVGSGQLEAIKQDFANELQRKMDAAAREFKEVLAAKDMELVYRDDEKASLAAEVSKLNAEKARLISQGGEQFLHRLAEYKVSFVAYHQGVGNINIGIEHIGEYLSNPIAYVAHSCKVTEQAYTQWLKHYENPVCQSFSELKGEPCGKPLKAVVNPSQFVMGRSDRCPLHWSFGDIDTAKGKA